MVEEFECPNDTRSYVVWGNLPLVESPKANWFWVKDQTKTNSEDTYQVKKQ